jgi:ribonuclease HI
MSDTVIFLNKEREGYKWSYVFAGTRFFVTAHGNLLAQAVSVITHIRDTHELHDKSVSICSTAFHRSIFYDLTITFPMLKLIPVSDSDLARLFRKVMERSDSHQPRVKNSSTLFICSDASKSVNNNLCGWAWFSSETGKKSYNFGVTEQRSIVAAEFEGILHAIIDNANSAYSTIHVYCDSQRSVEFAQEVLTGRVRSSSTLKALGNKRIKRLAAEVLEISKTKNLRIQWVKGHRSHRLNMGADYLSRAARVASERQGRLMKSDSEVVAIMSMFP